ncbi:FecR family protein [Marinoscillum furvescens]|uniref:FecR family protein n=1 Tax=Marinoscillum furvescens DSM 4134 TaxID=1122208 RepID=A0A3D9LHY8_MARFU|nr:FecR domain-containing protein [Marinoscillum furvescens]REE05639.1 FecR family protein [Marinoscillum furvescens DSM 4134]
MKNERSHSISEEVLARYFAGSATTDETRQVEAWANQSPANSQQLWQWQVAWMDARAIRGADYTDSYNVNKAWKKVKPAQKSTHRWSIAAAVAALLCAMVVLYQYSQQVEQVKVAAVTQTKSVALADGSTITLNTASEVEFPETFEGQTREVKLKGEAFFEVAHDPEQPFIVSAGDLQVQVLGTAFNVKQAANTLSVAVKSGKVQVTYKSEQVILTAGQRVAFDAVDAELKRSESTTLAEADHFWRTRRLEFKGNTLPEVVEALNLAYDQEVVIGSEALNTCKLSVSFEAEKLEDVIEIIRLTLNLEVQRTPDQYILTGNGCLEN